MGHRLTFDLNLLQQREHAGLVMVASGRGGGVFVFGSVVCVECYALKTAGHTVCGGNHPLQKGVGAVVCRCGIHQRVGVHTLPASACTGLQLCAADKRGHVSRNELGSVALDQVKRQCGVGGMNVGVVAVLATFVGGVPGAVLGFVRSQCIGRHLQAGALGKFTQVVQIGRQRHAARSRQ